jgi:ribA/ribD-fused uncharacterized protein
MKLLENEHGKFCFFWTNQDFQSNWYPAPHTSLGHQFANTEQSFMYAKALAFQDHYTANKILITPDPRAAKELGRQVKGYDEGFWASKRFDIMVCVNRAKYLQNQDLGDRLISLFGYKMVEASKFDRVWGVGLSEDNAMIGNPAFWRGANLHGRALDQVMAEVMMCRDATGVS